MASSDSRAKLEDTTEGQDGDIFEGLAKRKSERIPAPPQSNVPRSSMVVPAADRVPPPPPGSVDARRTLLGLDDSPPPPSALPTARGGFDDEDDVPPISQMPTSDTFRAALRAAPSPTFNPTLQNQPAPSAPPPPPGRQTLPRISVPPPPPSGALASAQAVAATPMDADWDEDKETLVYDHKNNPLLPPPSSMAGVGSTLPHAKRTLVGVNDASARSFSESSPSLSQRPSSSSLSQQVRTEPLAMPARPALRTIAAELPAPRAIPIAAPSEPIVIPGVGDRPASRTWLYAGAGVFALSLAAAGIAVSLTPAKAGKLQLRIHDAKGASVDRVEIFIDGKKACDTSPCMIEGLSNGEHQVKIMTPGAVAITQSVAIVSGRETELPITLAPALTGTLRVAGPVGAHLLVDDRDMGALPLSITDIAPGEHEIRIAGSDRFAAFEKKVSLDAAHVTDVGVLPAPVLKGKVTLKLETEGAQVFLVDGSERRKVTELPSTIDALDTSKKWVLEATKAGFIDFRLPLAFEDGHAEKTVSIALQKIGEKAAPAPAAAQGNPAAAIAARPAAPSEKPAAPKQTSTESAKPSTAPSEAKAAGEGTLNLNSMPSSAVIVDGRPVGQTPVLGLTVAAGNHTIMFMNADQNLKKTLRVSVKNGETKAVVGKLRE